MHLIEVVLLICATSMPRADCQPDTAFDVIRAPKSKTFGLCGLQSQGLVARTALSRILAEGYYLKIVCTKSHGDYETEAMLSREHHP